MSTRETLEAFLPPHRLEAMDNRVRARLYGMARITLSVGGALVLAQQQRCFHCQGVMPILCSVNDACRPSREHALPASMRDKGLPYQAILLAHKLCNELRASMPFTASQWERAIAVWILADRHWLEAGKTASPFLGWVEMARQLQREVGQ